MKLFRLSANDWKTLRNRRNQLVGEFANRHHRSMSAGANKASAHSHF
jgi:hypothetical protein